MTTIYDFSALTIGGKTLNFEELRGKTLLIVNTASKCGLTPQLEGLEQLHQSYKDQGLVVLGFPCNQFARQDPESSERIAQFCMLNYGVSFTMMQKVRVNGKTAHPLFAYLKQAAPGCLCNAIKWNFTKFLISPDGKTLKRFAPTTKPHKLIPDIERMLAKQGL